MTNVKGLVFMQSKSLNKRLWVNQMPVSRRDLVR